jgi:hypothetical protein
MMTNAENQELRDRLDLIENMIDEGRRSTERWGWVFVLWGVAYYAAFAWSSLDRSWLAWPVTMIAAGLLTSIMAGRRTRNHPRTGIGRAIGSIWLMMGVSLFVLMISLGFSGRLDSHLSLAIVGSMLAIANGASSMILRWKIQSACALVWLGAAEAGCFGTETQGVIAFLVATFFCQIVFGIYAMMRESRRPQVHGETHA